jgi:hypothetical protein
LQNELVLENLRTKKDVAASAQAFRGEFMVCFLGKRRGLDFSRLTEMFPLSSLFTSSLFKPNLSSMTQLQHHFSMTSDLSLLRWTLILASISA